MSESAKRRRAESRLKRLTSLMEGCARFGADYRASNDLSVAPGSPLSAELDDPQLGRYCREGFNIAVALHVVAEDHLVGWARLMTPPPKTVFPQQVVVRSAVEASARAWYLMDPEIESSQRAARYLNERAQTIAHTAKISIEEAASRKADERLEALWERAAQLGLEVLATRKGDPFAVEEPRPNSTDLIGALFAWADERVGGLIWRHHSGVSHATLGAILSSFEVGEPSEAGVRIARPQVTSLDVELQMAVSATSWALAHDRTAHMAGWPLDPWISWRTFLLQVINGGPLGERSG